MSATGSASPRPSLREGGSGTGDGSGDSVMAARAVKAELRHQLTDLATRHGSTAALLPGLPEEKAVIDRLLEELTSLSQRGGTAAAGSPVSRRTLAPIECEHLDERVLGEWELVYASNGTVGDAETIHRADQVDPQER